MVITILEAHVETGKWSALQDAYKKGLGQLPPQMMQTYLIQGAGDKTLWQIVSVWKSRAALDEMRNSMETPAGVLMFRAAGAEPRLSVFDVSASAP
jgi:quinol monooxygenase YgiN